MVVEMGAVMIYVGSYVMLEFSLSYAFGVLDHVTYA